MHSLSAGAPSQQAPPKGCMPACAAYAAAWATRAGEIPRPFLGGGASSKGRRDLEGEARSRLLRQLHHVAQVGGQAQLPQVRADRQRDALGDHGLVPHVEAGVRQPRGVVGEGREQRLRTACGRGDKQRKSWTGGGGCDEIRSRSGRDHGRPWGGREHLRAVGEARRDLLGAREQHVARVAVREEDRVHALRRAVTKEVSVEVTLEVPWRC